MGVHEEMKLLEYLNIKHSSVYITRSSIAVEDKKNQNYPAILGYIPKPLPCKIYN
jgi:hypothetical protein